MYERYARGVFAVSLVVSGCGLGHLVHPSDAVRLETTDALLAMDVDIPNVVTLALCRDADYGACLTTGPMSTDRPVQLYQVPAGMYCVMVIDYEFSAWARQMREVDADRSACFVLRAGVINDPGTFVLAPTPARPMSFDPHWDLQADASARIAAQYPDLAAMPVVPTRLVEHRRLFPHDAYPRGAAR